jgi:hypothetical protein
MEKKKKKGKKYGYGSKILQEMSLKRAKLIIST